ncbi:helix-turn-helix domain-containing protein [Brenneria tiliae]|uniref:Helix-turn-helix domain-containing protein n=1 Tax=Brenneria tiliae TaxID=2914984 RepID=A0ABT0MXS5_9GAMM|nr:helix-turn-helix transcriptional regulator [Brenneria tiliae]MCL2894636.1 helix-turn-helix domain-containing protein [Brenneria tiliae]
MLTELGQRLREHRLRQNIRQRDLASRSGISESALKRLENTGQGTLLIFMEVAFALRLESELTSLFKMQPINIAQHDELKMPVRQRAKSPYKKPIAVGTVRSSERKRSE